MERIMTERCQLSKIKIREIKEYDKDIKTSRKTIKW